LGVAPGGVGLPLVVTVGDPEGPSLEFVVGGSLGCSVGVTLDSAVGDSDTVTVGLPLVVTVGDPEGPSLELVVGASLGWSVGVTLDCGVGASDAVTVGLGDAPGGVGLPLVVIVGDPEGPSLELVVGGLLGWSVGVTLDCAVGASDAVIVALPLVVTVGDPEGLPLELVVGGSLSWSVGVTLGCAIGASDAVTVGLGDAPGSVGLPLVVSVGDPEGTSLELVVGGLLGWSVGVILSCDVGASDAITVGLGDAPGIVGLPLVMRVGDPEGPSLELVVGGLLGWSVGVTLDCAVGASDAITVGLGGAPGSGGLPLAVGVGDPEGLSLELVVGGALDWSTRVRLDCAVGASDAVTVGSSVAPGMVGLPLVATAVGDPVGASLGLVVDGSLGWSVGVTLLDCGVGASDAVTVGLSVAPGIVGLPLVATAVGDPVGPSLVLVVGRSLGPSTGVSLGWAVGNSDAVTVGLRVASGTVGLPLCEMVGLEVVGDELGATVGALVDTVGV
jgi:hypothetical protein